MKKPKVVNRREFIRRWMEECGVTFDVACQLYRTMVQTFEDGIANGDRIGIGHLGALVPRWQETRTVTMGCRRVVGKVLRQKQTYILDPRIRYRFKIYRQWMATRHLNWFD